MNCKSFEKLVEAYQDGCIADELPEMNAHLERCPDCRNLLRAVRASNQRLLPPELEIGFSDTILARTSGPACRRAGGLLADFVDGTLAPVEHELITSHLDSCPACAELARVLMALRETLPQLAEMTPPEDLAPPILHSIRAFRWQQAGLFRRVRDFLAGLVERPRFSWEAAYLGTLLICAIFGTPFSPVHDAGPRLLATLNSEQGLVTQTKESFAEWGAQLDLGKKAIQQAKTAGTRLYGWTARTENLLATESSRRLQVVKSGISSTAASFRTTARGVYHKWNVRETKQK